MAVNVSELLNLDFDQQYGLAQGMPADVKLSKEGFKQAPIKINLAEKKGIGVGAIAKEEDEEVAETKKAKNESLRAKRKAKRLKESKIRRQVLNKANSNKVLIERFQKLANIKK